MSVDEFRLLRRPRSLPDLSQSKPGLNAKYKAKVSDFIYNFSQKISLAKCDLISIYFFINTNLMIFNPLKIIVEILEPIRVKSHHENILFPTILE